MTFNRIKLISEMRAKLASDGLMDVFIETFDEILQRFVDLEKRVVELEKELEYRSDWE